MTSNTKQSESLGDILSLIIIFVGSWLGVWLLSTFEYDYNSIDNIEYYMLIFAVGQGGILYLICQRFKKLYRLKNWSIIRYFKGGN